MAPKILSKILLIAVLGVFLMPSGCLFYFKTIPVNDLSSIKKMPLTDTKIVENADYSKMTAEAVIEFVKTPAQAQHYLDTYFEYDIKEASGFSMIFFNVRTKGESFKQNHAKRKGICIDYATAAAALLSDDGYPPLLLLLKRPKGMHACFLYRTEEGFGCLGTWEIKPLYKTVEELVISLDYPKYDYYCVVNLDEQFENRQWIDGDVDLQMLRVDKWIKVRR